MKEEEYDPEDIINIDKSAHLTGKSAKKDEILVTRKGKRTAKKRSQSNTTRAATNGEVPATLGYTLVTSAKGNSICHVTHVVDDQLDGCSFERLYDTSSDGKCLKFALFLNSKTDKQSESSMLIDQIILPVLVQRRKERIRSMKASPTSPIYVGDKFVGEITDEDADLNKMIILFDGELNNLDTLLSHTDQELAEIKIILIKLAAACSKTTQPNDLIKMFMNFHKWYSGEEFQSFSAQTFAYKPEYTDFIEEKLDNLTPARRAMYMKHFISLPHAISCSVHVADVQRGFYDAGIFPPSPERMMERWCYWDKLTVKEKKYVLDAVKLIAAQMLGSSDDERFFDLYGISVPGTPCDSYMELLLSPIFGEILRKAKDKKEMTQYVLNRWRWTLITKDVRLHFLDKEEARAQAEDAKVAAAAGKLRKKEEAAAKKAAKEAYDKTPEGQRILREKAEAKSKRLDHLGSHAKNPKDLQCSYCQLIYKHINGQSWLKCSILSHTKCSVISCQGIQNCCVGYAQHISIAAEQQQDMVIDEGKDEGSEGGGGNESDNNEDMVIDEGKDEGSDGGVGNESDNNDAMEGNDDGDFDDDGEEYGSEYEKEDLFSMNE